jgi:pyridoxamine 5'-phosphate oxidase
VTLPDPIALARRWIEEAARAGAAQPDAMALATADADGRPSVRMVLMRGLDQEGFRFYTNRHSRKAAELAANPRAALAFHWEPPGLQLRAEGEVRILDDEASDAYFAGRPRESQLGAWASDQSSVLESREQLLEAYAAEQRRFGDGPVPRPPYWGGYLLVPDAIEFWEHGDFRLHRRRLFTRQGDGWTMRQLAP